MSSELKDARWQLASELASQDHVDFYKAANYVQESFLQMAQGAIEAADDPAEVSRLAAKFREPDGD